MSKIIDWLESGPEYKAFLNSHNMADIRNELKALVKEYDNVRAENERLREETVAKQHALDSARHLLIEMAKDAERWRKARPQLYVYYNSGTGHWQLCMVAGGISGHADYFPTVEQAIDAALKDGS